MKSLSRLSLFVLMALFLSACVTTTNRVPINVEAAYKKRIDLGMKYLSVGKRENARWQFNKALELDKNSAEAYQGLALVHLENGELQPSREAFQKALKFADGKNRSSINVSYGKYLMETGEQRKACDYFEKGGSDFDFSRRAEALYLAGKCAQKIGNTHRIKPAFEHALNLSPNYSAVLLELAEIYFTEGDYTSAKRNLDRFEARNSTTAQSLWLGIRIEKIFGNKDKEASYALALKNRHPYSEQYLKYQQQFKKKK